MQVIHSLVLFYQVVTLNVAINSHNNALLTLLVSNQFVELKGSVFKKFEKENLFQISCSGMCGWRLMVEQRWRRAGREGEACCQLLSV